MIIINAAIRTMDKQDFENGYIRIAGSTIAEIGEMKDLKPKTMEEILDACGAVVTPGLIDAHSHIGIWEDGLNFEGADGNEEYEPVTPHLRALDAVNPMDDAFSEALEAGVTTVVTGPGSANPIGGQLLALKTFGKRVDRMVVKEPLALKIAFGENPKTVYNEKNEQPSTRMTTAAIIRENFQKAEYYLQQVRRHQEDPDEEAPEPDIKAEALALVLEKKIPLHAHVHRADDIFTAIRIAKEFDLELVLVHCTEGHLVADELSAEGYPVLSGPILTDRSKPELKHQSTKAPGILARHGVKLALITDHPETPEKFLPLCAAVAVRDGLPRDEALRAITIYAAEICGIADQVGSITPGKDADLVIWDGNPLDIMCRPKHVLCNGQLVV